MGNEVSSSSSSSSSSSPRSEAEEAARRTHAITRMDASLRQKLQRGVQMNMKVLLRGERGSGKSALLRRLQGHPFSQEYTPSPQIDTATISWKAKGKGAAAAEEVCKVEVWEVVDKGLHDKGDKGADPDALAGLPSLVEGRQGSGMGAHTLGVLDATILDVYKDAQCAVWVVNPFSATALAYVRQEVDQAPAHIPVLFILNFRDLLPDEDVEAASSSSSSSAGGRAVHVTLAALHTLAAEQQQQGRTCHAFACSQKNCFGLRVLFEYLNVPFLMTKELLLRKQLEQTQQERVDSLREVEDAIAQGTWAAYVANLREKEEAKKGKPPMAMPSEGDSVPPAAAAAAGSASRPTTAASSSASSASALEPKPRGGVEEHKSTSSAAPSAAVPSWSASAPRHRQQESVPPEGRPPTPQDGGLVDVDDFTFQPKGERSELDAFLADGEELEEEEEPDEAQREAARRRQSLTSCLKSGSLESLTKAQRRAAGMFVSDDARNSEDDEEEEDDDEENRGEQRYVGLKPVNFVSPLSDHGTAMVGPFRTEEAEADDDSPAGLPSGAGVPEDFFNGDEEKDALATSLTATSKASGMATSTISSSSSSSPSKASNQVMLSDAARAAIAATMQSMGQELGGMEEPSVLPEEEGRKKGGKKHRAHKKKESSSSSSSSSLSASSSSRRKHKKKSSSDKQDT